MCRASSLSALRSFQAASQSVLDRAEGVATNGGVDGHEEELKVDPSRVSALGKQDSLRRRSLCNGSEDALHAIAEEQASHEVPSEEFLIGIKEGLTSSAIAARGVEGLGFGLRRLVDRWLALPSDA